MRKAVYVILVLAAFVLCACGDAEGTRYSSSSVVAFDAFPEDYVWAEFGFSSAPSAPASDYAGGGIQSGIMVLDWTGLDSPAYNTYMSILGIQIPGNVLEQGAVNDIIMGSNIISSGMAEGRYWVYEVSGQHYMLMFVHVISTFTDIFAETTFNADDAWLVVQPITI